MTKLIFTLLTILCSFSLLAQQKDSLVVTVDSISIAKRAFKKQQRIDKREARRIKNIRPYNALAPSKAAFYSAVLPGLGQIYNKKYWKVPIVYGALGTGIGIALWNNRNQNETRDIISARLRGVTTDRLPNLSIEDLVRKQELSKKQKELSIVISIALYVLNIVDANVTAHLQQYNLNSKLTVAPKLEINDLNYQPNYGLSMSYRF